MDATPAREAWSQRYDRRAHLLIVRPRGLLRALRQGRSQRNAGANGPSWRTPDRGPAAHGRYEAARQTAPTAKSRKWGYCAVPPPARPRPARRDDADL